MRIKGAKKAMNGLSLVEVMIVVALVGVIAAFAFPRIGNVKTGTEEVKLFSDVVVLNSAVKVYLANGGYLPSDASLEEVIEKIGRSVSADQSDTFVGFTGSMVDNRLKANMIPEAKITSTRSRAVWNASASRFEITNDPVSGVLSFSLDKEESEETGRSSDEQGGDRSSSMKYASNTNWVWDYTEGAAAAPLGPSVIPVTSIPGDSTPPSATPMTPTASGPQQLLPPDFSISPGSYDLTDFGLTLTLSNPNPAGSSIIYVQRPGQSWQAYGEGTEIAVLPNEDVRAFALSNDPARYQTSEISGGTYDATPFQLALRIVSNSTTVTYWDIIDADTRVDLRVPNIWRVPDFLRKPGLFSTYYTSNGADPRSSVDANHLGSYDGVSDRDTLRLDPSHWSTGEDILELKAFAKSSVENLVRSSTVTTTTVIADPLVLDPPAISMVEQNPGEQMVSLELQGRYPPGTRIFYNTAGDPPYVDPETGAIVNGTEYVGPFLLDVNLDTPAEQPGDTVDIGNGVNDVQIKQVVLTSNNQRIEQNESYYFDNLDNPGFDGGRDNEVVDRSNDRIELDSITIEQEGKTIVADNVNVLTVDVRNLNISGSAEDNDVTVKRNGQVVANLGDRFQGNGGGNGRGNSGNNGGHDNSKFANEVEATLRSTNLRDYIDYSSGSKSRLNTDHDFDVIFSPLTNNDFLVVMERFGNSTFDLRPLDARGNLIAGGNRLTFRAYSWNTGHAPSDTGGQAMFFSVIDIEQFGVDTNLNSIAGFRLNNDGGADFKFFTISDESFENREVRYTGQIQAVAVPPENLDIWFEPSVVSSREVEGTTTAPTP